jgi:uncharacterized protein (TIGR03083 family)
MDSAALLAALATEGTALADAADGHLDQKVNSCPDWTVRQLVGHVGQVHAWVCDTVAAGGERVAWSNTNEPPGDDAALVAWYQSGLEKMVKALSVDAETPAWTFNPKAPDNVGWWQRRQALETAIHRWDAQDAAGVTPVAPIDGELAVEGIDELLEQWLPRLLASNADAGLKGTFHLHATDTPGEWWLDFDAPELAARREHAKADTAVRGPASGLYLWLWNRQTPEEAGLDVFGQTETVTAWRSIRI